MKGLHVPGTARKLATERSQANLKLKLIWEDKDPKNNHTNTSIKMF